MPYLTTKGPKKGRCNICGNLGKLTEDHVPPKGVIKFPKSRLYPIMDALQAPRPAKSKGRNFQNGVKFRSICGNCNGDWLGALYDPHLIEMTNQVGQYLNSLITLPSVARIDVQPGLVLRSILGHVLAIGVERFPRGEMGDVFAELVLDPDKEIPKEIGVYYWVYPYWDHVMIRGFGFMEHFGGPVVISSVIKYTPLAFMVTWDTDSSIQLPHFNLVDYCIGSGMNRAEIPVNFINLPSIRYPEAPGNDGATLHGRDSYLSRRL